MGAILGTLHASRVWMCRFPFEVWSLTESDFGVKPKVILMVHRLSIAAFEKHSAFGHGVVQLWFDMIVDGFV